ncbi:TerD family protein [Kitasatospora sp. CB01950]|uniref:TerD family protein n=1 Tax=Kitasatospora sp. CB01950 TaxID=1703930 RepID=UPI00093C507D|nr:TerD family protein [Kitasatospora sp. CB01950]OKJ13582.1 TerD-family protein [Kitasatospora sp. CB01950]
MSTALAKGANVPVLRDGKGPTSVLVGLGWQVGGEYDLDANALLCDGDGKALSDQHFVFFNNLTSPDGAVTHITDPGTGTDREQLRVDLGAVEERVQRIVFTVAIYQAEERRQAFGSVHGAYVRVADAAGGSELARYELGPEVTTETAVVFGELYRHGGGWKFRAIGQGYATGLAGIATDFGIAVLAPAPVAPVAPAAPAAPPMPAAPPAAVAVPTPTVAVPAALPPEPLGGSPVTCFFDPAHGPGTTAVLWSPQWGVPRQIQSCGACAQRVQTTPPPYYTAPAAAGYPQQQGYAQPGYPQQGGYPAQPEQQQGGRRFGTGAMIGAGAAGLVGGALLAEAFDDDSPDVVVNNYYED